MEKIEPPKVTEKEAAPRKKCGCNKKPAVKQISPKVREIRTIKFL